MDMDYQIVWNKHFFGALDNWWTMTRVISIGIVDNGRDCTQVYKDCTTTIVVEPKMDFIETYT